MAVDAKLAGIFSELAYTEPGTTGRIPIPTGGQRQRSAIAHSVLNRPEILMFGEARSNLDGHNTPIFRSPEVARATLRFYTGNQT